MEHLKNEIPNRERQLELVAKLEEEATAAGDDATVWRNARKNGAPLLKPIRAQHAALCEAWAQRDSANAAARVAEAKLSAGGRSPERAAAEAHYSKENLERVAAASRYNKVEGDWRQALKRFDEVVGRPLQLRQRANQSTIELVGVYHAGRHNAKREWLEDPRADFVSGLIPTIESYAKATTADEIMFWDVPERRAIEGAKDARAHSDLEKLFRIRRQRTQAALAVRKAG